MGSVDLLSFRQSIPPIVRPRQAADTRMILSRTSPLAFSWTNCVPAGGGRRNTILRAGVTYNTFYGRN